MAGFGLQPILSQPAISPQASTIFSANNVPTAGIPQTPLPTQYQNLATPINQAVTQTRAADSVASYQTESGNLAEAGSAQLARTQMAIDELNLVNQMAISNGKAAIQTAGRAV